MSTQEESRFGDKQASADNLEVGGVAWVDGTSPALVVSVNRGEGEDVSATVAPLTVETVHVNDVATEYVDPTADTTSPAVPAPPAVAPPAQPPADDPTRQTTPTGEPVGGGTATPVAAAAQAGDIQSLQAELANANARIAELEAAEAAEDADEPIRPETVPEPMPTEMAPPPPSTGPAG